MNIITFANQFASGASNSLWLMGAGVVATSGIFMASLKNGIGGHSHLDIFSMSLSLFGVGLWVVFDSALLSVLANTFVTLVAVLPTIKKSYHEPESETRITFLLGGISAGLAALSVGKLSLVLLLPPITGFVLQAYLSYLLYIRPRKQKPHTQ